MHVLTDLLLAAQVAHVPVVDPGKTATDATPQAGGGPPAAGHTAKSSCGVLVCLLRLGGGPDRPAHHSGLGHLIEMQQPGILFFELNGWAP